MALRKVSGNNNERVVKNLDAKRLVKDGRVVKDLVKFSENLLNGGNVA